VRLEQVVQLGQLVLVRLVPGQQMPFLPFLVFEIFASEPWPF
jgi:hypothetical protein